MVLLALEVARVDDTITNLRSVWSGNALPLASIWSPILPGSLGRQVKVRYSYEVVSKSRKSKFTLS